jgi:hypothetical protein
MEPSLNFRISKAPRAWSDMQQALGLLTLWLFLSHDTWLPKLKMAFRPSSRPKEFGTF